MDEWEADHARPLVAKAIPDTVQRAIDDAKRAVDDLLAERPLAAVEALRRRAGPTPPLAEPRMLFASERRKRRWIVSRDGQHLLGDLVCSHLLVDYPGGTLLPASPARFMAVLSPLDELAAVGWFRRTAMAHVRRARSGKG